MHTQKPHIPEECHAYKLQPAPFPGLLGSYVYNVGQNGLFNRGSNNSLSSAMLRSLCSYIATSRSVFGSIHRSSLYSAFKYLFCETLVAVAFSFANRYLNRSDDLTALEFGSNTGRFIDPVVSVDAIECNNPMSGIALIACVDSYQIHRVAGSQSVLPISIRWPIRWHLGYMQWVHA